MTSKNRYGVVNVVWGTEFTRLMADVTLPTNLSDGNLPALSRAADVNHIHCTRESEVMLRDSAIFPKLADTVAVEFHTIESEDFFGSRSQHALLTDRHRHAVAIAQRRDEILIILAPDAIWSDGSFLRMHELAHDGARTVMMAVPRATKSSFLTALETKFPEDISSGVTLDNRTIMRLLLENLHICANNHIWREERLTSWPSQLLWRVGREGLLVRAFHLHPVLIRPTLWDGAMPGTIDGEYVANAIQETSKIYVVRDSDEIAGVEISATIEGNVHRSTPNTDSGTKRVAAWMRRSTNSLHRQYVRNMIRLHANEIDPACETLWNAAEEASNAVLDRVNHDYARLERPSVNPNDSGSLAGTVNYAS
ncbi:MAG: hypothetical protein IH881_14560 [Myxococcales bacterium]|nr:hypothetical protein [Myxococcales bacterium]